MATPIPEEQRTEMEKYLMEQIASLTGRLGTAEETIVNNLASAKQRDNTIASDTNIEWLIVCGALGFFMQAGFAMLECGAVSKNNVINILFKNLVDNCVAGVNWWLFAYAFAYGDTAGGFIGKTNFAISDMYNGAKSSKVSVLHPYAKSVPSPARRTLPPDRLLVLHLSLRILCSVLQ